MLRCIYICDRGLVRKNNQDRVGVFFNGDKGLFLVSDGMGGHFAGEKASEAVLDALSNWWNGYLTAPQRPGFSQVLEQLRDVIQQTNEKIYQSTPPKKICGATLVALCLSGREYAVFSAGDSRCYQIGRKVFLPYIVQLTTDDVVIGSQDRRQNGKLLRAIGAAKTCAVTVQTGKAPENTIFLLCSDGIYKACPETTLKKILQRTAFGASLEDAGAQIERAVRSSGAPDNYSLILVKTEN